MRQPNIVLIESDQHRWDCVGVNGPHVQTPHLDRLAAQGATFRQAYCPSPLCGPARTSLLTGQWAHCHRSLTNWDAPHWAPIPDNIPTFSRTLREAGYHLCHLAKWHVDPRRKPPFFGYHDSQADEEFENRYVEWRKASGLPDRPINDGWFRDVSPSFGFVDASIRPEQSRLGYGCEMALRCLERCAAAGRPFFFSWNPPEPHFPCVVPEPYASMYPPAAITPWQAFDEPPGNKPYMHGQMRLTWGTEKWRWEDWAPHIAKYFGEISLLDALIGRILQALDHLGLSDNTIVIYTTDHGDMTGNHRMIDKHHVMYDDLVRTPLIVRAPGLVKPGTVVDDFVSNALDLAVTFCDLAGAEPPNTFQGQSLLPLLRGQAKGRSDIYSEYFGYQFGLYSQRMVRNAQYKYVYNMTDADELYDLEKDPAERVNLTSQPEYADALVQMRRRMAEWMEQSRDRQINAWVRKQLLDGRKR